MSDRIKATPLAGPPLAGGRIALLEMREAERLGQMLREQGADVVSGPAMEIDWNHLILDDTLGALWTANSNEGRRERQTVAAIAGLIGIGPKVAQVTCETRRVGEQLFEIIARRIVERVAGGDPELGTPNLAARGTAAELAAQAPSPSCRPARNQVGAAR